MFTFCPLQGARSESSASQSILELDGGVRILIDVGWDETFDVEKLKELEKQVPTLSLILLTHATVSHLGAYAHCCKHFPLFTRIPVYATTPVISLGRTLLQDLYSSTPCAATSIPSVSLNEGAYTFSQSSGSETSILLQAPTPDEIVTYFSLIHPLKYSQLHQPLPSPFSPPLNGLSITAYNSGHTLGGTIWHIQHGLESIVYAVDWNQVRENVYAGAAWLGGPGGGGAEVIEQLRKPTALVCSSRGGDKATVGPRTKRDQILLGHIRLAIARGGTVLIPVDSSARVLELAYLLEHEWRTDSERGPRSLRSAKLFLAGRNMASMIRYAKSMLEWMDESIVREFEQVADTRRSGGRNGDFKAKDGPLDFTYLRVLERKAQIDRMLSMRTPDGDPMVKIILASDSSMEWGFSKHVLREIARDNRNLVILTERPNLGNPDRPSLARTLWSWHLERRDGGSTDETASGEVLEQVYGGARRLQIEQYTRTPLEESELPTWQQWLATQRQLHSTLQAGSATVLEVSGGEAEDDASSDSSSSSDDSDTVQQGKALNASATQASRKKVVLRDEDLGINILFKKEGMCDFATIGKRGKDRMLPIHLRKARVDNFGEVIRPEDFVRAEEREDEEAEANGDGVPKETALGQKKKWDHVGARSNKDRHKARAGHDEPDSQALERQRDEIDNAEDMEEEEILGPSKLRTTMDETICNLRIAHVDFEGLHDKRALLMLIPLIQPRKLILTAGTAQETLSLQGECQQLLSLNANGGDSSETKAVEVFAPSIMECVNASVDTNAWVVKLSEDLVKTLRWQRVGGLSIAAVAGQLLVPSGNDDEAGNQKIEEIRYIEGIGDDDGNNRDLEDTASRKRLKTEEPDGTIVATPGPAESTLGGSTTLVQLTGDESSVMLPVLAPLTKLMRSTQPAAAAPVHVGEIRLADLRRQLQNANHVAEFRGEGTLVVDNVVTVRKTAAGKIEIDSISLPTDGGAGAKSGGTFYAVRQMIYSGLAVVGGE